MQNRIEVRQTAFAPRLDGNVPAKNLKPGRSANAYPILLSDSSALHGADDFEPEAFIRCEDAAVGF